MAAAKKTSVALVVIRQHFYKNNKRFNQLYVLSFVDVVQRS